MEIQKARVVEEYKVFDDYIQDMLDIWAYGFEATKWRFHKLCHNITLSTTFSQIQRISLLP